MLIGSWGQAPRPGRRAAVFGACLAFLVGQTVMPFGAQAATEDFDLLRLQLNTLVAQRATFLAQLAEADGQVGSLLSRDLLQASRPIVAAQGALATTTLGRAARDPLAPPAARRVLDRSAGSGLLLGAHVPSMSPPPPVPARNPARLAQVAWHQEVLAAPALVLAQPVQGVGGSDGPVLGAAGVPRGAGSLLVPASSVTGGPHVAAAPAGSGDADPGAITGGSSQPRYQVLGPAQDLQPARGIQVGAGLVSLRRAAPQSVEAAPPVATLPLPVDAPPAAARTDWVLHAFARATALLRTSLDSVAAPDSLVSQGLDPKARLTNLAKVQAWLGQYVLSGSPGGLSTAPASSETRFPSGAQVSWTFTASVPTPAGGSTALSGTGHANGTSIHDLQIATAELPAAAAAAPGASVSLSLSADGAGLLDVTAAGANGSAVRLQMRVEGVGADPDLQAALGKERLAQAQLSGVIPAGDTLYARLLPEYQVRLQIYNGQLSQVMARNNAVEQAWWAKATAFRAYNVALAQWKERATAWERHLHGGVLLGAPPPSTAATAVGYATPVQGLPSASPTGAPAPAPATPTTQAPAQVPTSSAVPTATPTPPGGSGGLFGQAAGGGLVVHPSARVAASQMLASVPTPAQVPLFGTPSEASPTALPATVTSTATTPPATVSPTSVPSVLSTAPAGASPSVSASPTAAGMAIPAASPGPLASPVATAPPDTVPLDGPPLAPPGPPPTAVPSPGLEPQMDALPPPVLPLPGWVDAPVAVYVAPRLQSAMPMTLNAAGWADISYDQLLADGAMDGVSGYISPIRGAITTLWGGSTGWQSFHPGIDIATKQDTPVVASAAGIVIYAGLAVPGDPTSSYGNCVMIQHNAVISTVYGHMDMGDHDLQVVVGQQVRQGQIIGYEGATGWATGPHVHFEMRVNNTQFNPELLVSEQQILQQP